MEERKVYLLFDKITPQLRAIVSVLLIGTGFLFQLSAKNIFVGLPFIIACIILNWMKGISIKRIKTGKLTWQEVTPEKIDQVLAHCKKIKKFRSKNIGCVVIIILLFAYMFIFPFSMELNLLLPFPLTAMIVNVLVLFIGLSLSGRRTAWMPSNLDIKSEIVKRIINSPIIKNDTSLQARPYLEIRKTKEGTLPNDARILIKFKDAPSEFIGLQGQISINRVKSKAYPYFYVVLIAKHEFYLYDKFGKHQIDKLVIERKRTKEVDVIVIRQRTTKTSGYHTNTAVQDYILVNSIKLTKGLF